ncbi:MAG: PDZ domain-containing protein [Akkermansiaceae bacterium]|nr:PDZ domain-containing protein [Akkermansiaceae bacterium]
MRLLPSVALLASFAALIAGAEEKPQPATPPQPGPAVVTAPGVPDGLVVPGARGPRWSLPGTWLGCKLSKPEAAATAQIPSLPPGMGLVVREVLAGSPAEAAKLEAMDVLWKFDDQLIANQAQLATLLNLKGPGDLATLTVFRAGQSIEAAVTLAAIPKDREAEFKEWRDRALFPGGFDPMVRVDRGARTATYKTDEGKAMVMREGEGYRVTIHDPKDRLLFDQVLVPGVKSDLPEGWHRRVWVLRRSLDHSLEDSLTPVRPPRPRVVPTPEKPEPPTAPAVSSITRPETIPTPGRGTSEH